MDILILFCPAILSLGIVELFITDIKEKGTWFKVKYIATVSMVIHFVCCIVIWKLKGEGFHFLFQHYSPSTLLMACTLYVVVSLLLTGFLIAMYNFLAIKIERCKEDGQMQK